jgi:hypothetical protein
MDVVMLSDAPWRQVLAAGVALLGLALVWRGLVGQPGGERGLIRRQTTMLGRLHGWRLFLLGLTLTGVGAAWYWDARWLLILSLGFGFVELQEATGVINAWRSNGGRGAGGGSGTRRPAPVGPHGGPTGGVRP